MKYGKVVPGLAEGRYRGLSLLKNSRGRDDPGRRTATRAGRPGLIREPFRSTLCTRCDFHWYFGARGRHLILRQRSLRRPVHCVDPGARRPFRWSAALRVPRCRLYRRTSRVVYGGGNNNTNLSAHDRSSRASADMADPACLVPCRHSRDCRRRCTPHGSGGIPGAATTGGLSGRDRPMLRSPLAPRPGGVDVFHVVSGEHSQHPHGSLDHAETRWTLGE